MVQQRLFIPSYFQPEAWKELLKSAEGSVVIINVYNGPGDAQDPRHVEIANCVRQAKDVTLLGYIHTQWGKRDIAVVENQIKSYQEWYGPMDGVFVDEVSTQAADIPYYEALGAAVRKYMPAGAALIKHGSCDASSIVVDATVSSTASNSSLASDFAGINVVEARAGHSTPMLVFNYGCQMPEEYMPLADIHVTFENHASHYSDYSPPKWTAQYPPERFCHLLYGVEGAAELRSLIQRSQERRAGWVYATPLGLPNPWGNLPDPELWGLLQHLVCRSRVGDKQVEVVDSQCPCLPMFCGGR